MSNKMKIVPDVSCAEATQLYEKLKQKPDSLKALILIQHEKQHLHNSDCYTQSQPIEQQTAHW